MPVDGSILAHASDGAISGTSALIQQYTNANPGLAYIEGQKARQAALIAAYQAQKDQQQLELNKEIQKQAVLEQNRRFALDVQKEDNVNERSNKELAVTLRGQDLTNQVAQGNLDVARGDLALKAEAQPYEIAYKQALIATQDFQRDPSNPQNIKALADAHKALQEANNPDPQSPQGKLYADFASGKLPINFLSSIQTSYDPATGQSTMRYIPGGVNGQPGTSGISQPGQPSLTETGAEDLQKQDNTALTKIREEAAAAQGRMPNLDLLDKAIDKFGVTGNITGPVKNYLLNIASQVGLFTDKALAGQTIKSIGNLLALSLRKDMPGQMSNSDRDFLVSSTTNLEGTVAGNKLMVNAMRAQNTLSVEYASLADKYRAKTGGLSGLNEVWSTYTNMYKVVGSDKDGNPTIIQPDRANINKVFENWDDIQVALKQGYSLEQIKAGLDKLG